MATVSVRYIVDDVDAAIAFYTERLGFGVEFNPPVSRSSGEATCASCSTSPVPAERAYPRPTGAILSQAAGTASNLRLTISPARSRRCATRRRTCATRSSAAEAASRSWLRTPPATPSNFSNPQGTDAAPHRCWTGATELPRILIPRRWMNSGGGSGLYRVTSTYDPVPNERSTSHGRRRCEDRIRLLRRLEGQRLRHHALAGRR